MRRRPRRPVPRRPAPPNAPTAAPRAAPGLSMRPAAVKMRRRRERLKLSVGQVETAPEPVKRRPGRPKATETPATPRQRTSKAAAIPAIDALLAMLPAAGQTWNAERRAAWFALAQHVLRP
jgi:hypothetical protein